MSRRNTAATITTILCAILFIVIGSSFSAFVYKKELIKVENPGFILAQGITVYTVEGDKEIQELELSKMKLGLKPATGEEDKETNIPSTVTDTKGSEGQYGKFKVYAPSGAKIFITNISIESKEDAEIIMKERENIMVSIKEIDKSTKSLQEEEVELGSTSATNEDRQTLTFMVWISGKVSNKLSASTISFDIRIDNLN